MDTSFTVILLTNITMASALFVYNYYDVILDILINGVNCSKITKSKVNSSTILSVNSDYGKLYLNKIKVPSDIDIYFFKQNFNIENGIMSKKVFSLLHNNKKMEQLTKYRDSLIISFRTSYDINGTDTLTGFIDSYFEDTVYMFKIKSNDDSKHIGDELDNCINAYRVEAQAYNDEEDLSGSDYELAG